MAKVKQMRVLIGNCMINFPMCISYMFGTIFPYMYSYFHFRLDSTLSNDLDPAWIFPIFLIFQGIGILSAGWVSVYLGILRAIFCGISLNIFYQFLMYFALQHSVWLSCLTLALGGGYSSGVLMTFNIAHVSLWFQEKVGQANSVLLATACIGNVFFNYVLTFFINPDNISTDVAVGRLTFFSNTQIVTTVPTSWILFGVLSACLQIPGFFLIAIPKTADDKSNEDESIAEDIDRSSSNVVENTGVGKTDSDDLCHETCQLRANGARADSEYYCYRQPSQPRVEVPSAHDLSPMTQTRDMTVKEVLSSFSFYSVWLAAVALNLAHATIFNYFKMFGQFWIADDQYLTLISSASSVFMVINFLILGKMIDKCGVINSLVFMLSLSCLLFTLWYFTARLNRWLYLICTDVLMASVATHVLLIPMSALSLFGRTNFIKIYGLLQGVSLVGYIAIPALASFLISNFGWFWFFLVGSGLIFVSLVLVLLARDSDD